VPNEPCPGELDALTAAPENHRLLFENDTVRMLDTVIQPGRTTPLHTHCWPAALYVLGGSDFIRRDQSGTVTFDSRNGAPIRPGASLFTPPLPPHTLENIGTTEIRIIAVELKNQI
jgi:quercetin dioxygenase-like cupin family protein